jgi:hypothetical protein
MNSSEKPRGLATISSEALVGIGITVAWLGLMFLLLGWAEYMRSVPTISLIWLVLGVAFVGLGGLVTALARSKDRLRIRTDRFLSSRVPQDEAGNVAEPEEQRY